ncbi:hypothetical protein, partial [Streptomyces prunicolor]|uniref:hypothetical protein n=1 Tax=Streptomyces prunicolor TaxID=67348 RepID=UPI003F4D2458
MNSCPACGSRTSRQSPAPATTAYSNSWVQRWSWKAEPSGAVRRGTNSLRITGSPTVTVHVKSTSDDTVLFGKVYD